MTCKIFVEHLWGVDFRSQNKHGMVDVWLNYKQFKFILDEIYRAVRHLYHNKLALILLFMMIYDYCVWKIIFHSACFFFQSQNIPQEINNAPFFHPFSVLIDIPKTFITLSIIIVLLPFNLINYQITLDESYPLYFLHSSMRIAWLITLFEYWIIFD